MRGCPFGGKLSPIPISFSCLRVSVLARVYSVSRRSAARGKGCILHTYPKTYNNSDTCPVIGVCDSGWGQNWRRRPSAPAPTRFCLLCFPISSNFQGGLSHRKHQVLVPQFHPWPWQTLCLPEILWNSLWHYPQGWEPNVQKAHQDRGTKNHFSVSTQNNSRGLFTRRKFRLWAQLKTAGHSISTEFCESSAGLPRASRQTESDLKLQSLEIPKLTSESSSW